MKEQLIQISNDNLSLENILNKVAIEAGFLSDMSDKISEIFPSMVSKFNKVFDITADLDNGDKGSFRFTKLTSEQQFLTKEIHTFDFIDIGELKIPVPEGFKGDLLSYCTHLDKAIKRLKNINTEVLNPFYTKLSAFLSSADAKKSLDDLSPMYKKIAKDRKEITEDIGEFFVSGALNVEDKLVNVIRRSADFHNLFDTVNQLKNDFHSIDINIIRSNVKKIEETLNIVITRQKEGDLTNASSESIKTLAFGAFEAASEVELFAIIGYKVMVLSTVIDALTVKVNKFIRDIPN